MGKVEIILRRSDHTFRLKHVKHNITINHTGRRGPKGDPGEGMDSRALRAIAPLDISADTMAYFTGPTTAALTDLTALARTLNSSSTAAEARSAIGAQSKFEITVGPNGDFPCEYNSPIGAAVNDAIQYAKATSNGGIFTITILPGTYWVEERIIPDSNMWIRGSGMFATKLQSMPNLSAGIFERYVESTVENPTQNLIISDIELDGSYLDAQLVGYHKGIAAQNWVNCHLYNIYCHDFNATGIGPDNLFMSTIDRCVALNNGTPNLPASTELTSDGVNVGAGEAVSLGDAYASGLLTSDGINPTDGEYIVLDSITYTFRTILTGVANEIRIGDTAALTLDYILAAVNKGPGIGVNYGTGTVKHPKISASTNKSTTQKFVAKLNGTGGNSLVTTASSAHLSFGAATLTGGTSSVYKFVSSLVDPFDVLIGASADDTLTNLAAAINLSAGAGTLYGTGTTVNPTVTAGTVNNHVLTLSAIDAGTATNTITTSETSSHLSFTGPTLSDGFSTPLGHNGFGIGGGGMPAESFVISNCVAGGSANNDYLIEQGTVGTGTESSYMFVNNISTNPIGVGFRNSGSPNVSFIGNFIYGGAKRAAIYTSDYTSSHVSNNVQIKDNLIVGVTGYGIYQGSGQNNYNISGNIIRDGASIGIICAGSFGQISNNQVHDNNSTGIKVYPFTGTIYPVEKVLISNNLVYNNGKTVNNTDGIAIGADGNTISDITIVNNICFDDQPTKTQRYGIILPTSSIYEMSNILVANNNVVGNKTGGILKQNTSNSISIKNNMGANSENPYVIGNVSGAFTVSRVNGNLQTFTLTANSTASIPAGLTGDRLTLISTQDSTGGWTLSLPVNVKVGHGGYTASTAANAVDVLELVYDGSSWREVARSLSTEILRTLDSLTITTANGSNKVSANITQNDVTNNPNGVNITNAGTSHGLNIAQTGILASSKHGLFVDTSAAQTAAPLSRMRVNNASATQATLQLDNSGSGKALVINTGGMTLAGDMTVSGGSNIAASTVTGTKIGTATSQKIGFYNATPIIQPTGNVSTALSNLGLVATPTIAEADVTNLTTDLAGKVSTSTATTKGDILVATGSSAISRLGVGSDGQTLVADSTQATGVKWGTSSAGTGDVVGPASSTDNALARFDSTTGKLVQNSTVTVDDNGVAAGLRQTSLLDSNGNPYLTATATASAIAGFNITNAISGGTVTLANVNTGNSPTIIKGSGSGLFAFRPGTDSTNAVRIQNASGGGSPFVVDTTNFRVGVNKTTPVSTLDVGGSISTAISTKTANYTLATNDSTILVDATSGNLTMTLPAVSGCAGRIYRFKKIDASANTVTIDGNASETIDGATTKVISTQYATLSIQSDGTSWWVV